MLEGYFYNEKFKNQQHYKVGAITCVFRRGNKAMERVRLQGKTRRQLFTLLRGGRLATRVAKQVPRPVGPLGLLKTRAIESLALLRHPTMAGVLPSFPAPRDAGLTGGRIKAGD